MSLHVVCISVLIIGLFFCIFPSRASACTAIALKAENGDVVTGRTMDWRSFDLMSRILIIPRGQEFTGQTPDGTPGLQWKGKYGVVGIDMLHQDVLADGLNEKGLSVSVLYLPDFAEFPSFNPVLARNTIGPLNVITYLLTTTTTVEEAREAIEGVNVVSVVEPAIHIPPPIHWIITDHSGKHIVIEYLKGKLVIHDAPLGVMTNAPSYDWHMTNLRNYINLSPTSLPGRKIEDLDFKPLGGGSGMIGLPGDFTPPSRFVRAVAFTQTARPTVDGPETLYEGFRILDNFNVPVTAAEGAATLEPSDVKRSATLWTVLNDHNNLTVSYHTQHNRRVRQVNFSDIDFDTLDTMLHIPLDKESKQDIEMITIPQ
ncbi:linear amide C-N hydrolase [Desulfovibrio inopinatus]|uniref:linear amide C-N hydrolase n=1 Tax=Desulfovibrio inopinatus TaxID=102109 RepID=UPI000405F304|nr:linear amide C-N hydrolase [Desulfovibrio inopinatus]